MGRHSIHRVAAALACGWLAACSNSFSESSPDDQLASVLESLANEANQTGDPDAGSAYSAAAMAFRLGIRPTTIEVTIGGESMRYRAFVHVVTHASTDATPIRLRTMVAVHGEDAVDAVLYLATVADSTVLVNPTLPLDRRVDLRQLAWAAWRDLESDQIWVATSGKAGIQELAVALGGPCPNLSEASSVQCTVAAFGVLLDGVFQPLIGNHRGQIDPARQLLIATRASPVAGAILTFPSS